MTNLHAFSKMDHEIMKVMVMFNILTFLCIRNVY